MLRNLLACCQPQRGRFSPNDGDRPNTVVKRSLSSLGSGLTGNDDARPTQSDVRDGIQNATREKRSTSAKNVSMEKENPLPIDETISGLKKLFFEKNGEHLPQEEFEEAFRRNEKLADESQHGKLAEKLESFSKSKEEEKLVKMYNDVVPDNILPQNYSAVLHDIKVDGKRQSDDAIYKRDKSIREKVPRGTTTLMLSGPQPYHDVVVYANKKFTGGAGDEDDDMESTKDELWREYFTADVETAKKIISMEKLNGDALHFSGRYINGKFYIFAGSKTTHLMIADESDIDSYSGERHGVAKRFARTVWKALNELGARERHLLYSLLHHTKVTAVCEVLQPEFQHIVDLSHLEENQLNFITFTPTFSEKGNSLTAFPPHVTLNLGRALGLKCATFEVIEHADVTALREKIRSERGSEGRVMYFINEQGDTIGLVKAKTVWYICLRALREKAVFTFISKKGEDMDMDMKIDTMFKRYDDIKNWLKVSDRCINDWKDIGKAFLEWLDAEIKEKDLDPKTIRPEFPDIWKRFLSHTGKDDNIPL